MNIARVLSSRLRAVNARLRRGCSAGRGLRLTS
jgi:hypothetical protein